MTPAEALIVLGLADDVDAAAVRSAFRDRVRATHPDLVGEHAATSERIARLTEAYRVLRATEPPRESDVAPGDPHLHPLHTAPGDPFMHLVDAAEDLGHVSYVDRNDRLIQVVVEPAGGPVCQLTIELDDDRDRTRAAFTLVALQTGDPPPIGDVVGRLQQILYSHRRSERSWGRLT